jgi:hypothetical protein
MGKAEDTDLENGSGSWDLPGSRGGMLWKTNSPVLETRYGDYKG